MVTSYIMPNDDEDEDGEDIKDIGPFVPVFELFNEAQGHWLIDCLAVYPHARGKGIGSLLLDNSLERGRKQKCKHASLITENTNAKALALYQSRGFTQAGERAFVPYDDVNDADRWILLTRQM